MFVSSIVASKGNKIVAARAEDSLAQVASRLAEHRIGAVLVYGPQGDIAGIISERDIVRMLAHEGAAALQRRVAEFMVTEVRTCEPEDTVDHVMEIMTQHRIRHLPVMQGGSVQAIISIGDVVKHLIDETRHEAEALKQYIAAG